MKRVKTEPGAGCPTSGRCWQKGGSELPLPLAVTQAGRSRESSRVPHPSRAVCDRVGIFESYDAAELAPTRRSLESSRKSGEM